jgi:glycerol-3-phosphate dehydrogenase
MLSDDADYDLVIVGGGINGAGIARDAALRGLRVLLLEKYDFGGGTSSWSSRLIHGGLRYLEYAEIPLVFESLHERQRLRHVAPHLVRQLRLNIPIYKQSRRSKLIIRLGMLAYDLLSIGKNVPNHRMLSRDQLIELEPGIRREGLLGGAQYFDAQVTFAERLVMENIIGASEAGAEVRNYSPVIGINVSHGDIRSVHYQERDGAQEKEVTTRLVINAAGPWVDRVLATVNRDIPRYMGGTKGSHIVTGPFEGGPKDAFYVEAESDGRPFFIIPWNQQFLIGTTDIRYHGDPVDAVASAAEISYLLDETNRIFPQAKLNVRDIHFAYAGVRPLPLQTKGPESAITRKHIIKKHRGISKGLVSIIGGKLTTYRNLAEQTVDLAVRGLKINAENCETQTLLLPGATGEDAARRALQALPGLSQEGVTRLLQIYGGRALRIAKLATDDAQLAVTLDASQKILAAEVVHAIRHEWAVTLIDIVHRRLMTGLAPDQGGEIRNEVAAIAAVEAGWSRSERQLQLQELLRYDARLRPKLNGAKDATSA